MRKLLISGLAATLLAGSFSQAAFADPPHGRGGPPGHEKHDRDDRGRGDRGGYHDNGRREWRGERFAVERYHPPRDYRAHHQWHRGERLPPAYRGRPYVIDHRVYHLAPPPRGYQYYRVDNDVVLVAIATGIISSVLTGMFYQ